MNWSDAWYPFEKRLPCPYDFGVDASLDLHHGIGRYSELGMMRLEEVLPCQGERERFCGIPAQAIIGGYVSPDGLGGQCGNVADRRIKLELFRNVYLRMKEGLTIGA